MARFSVRIAVADDADAIVRIHHAAVYDTARASYPPEILDAWAVQLIEESCQTVRREIADPAMIVLVAVSAADIAGFGMVVPAHEELRAVYVHPQFGRQGAGSAILQRLEELASARGVISLHLDSSINAEAF